MNKINTIIFDLDGTLLDSLDDLSNSVNFALRTYQFPQRSKKEIRLFLGNGIEQLMRCSVPGGISEDDFMKVFLCFRSHYVTHCHDLTRPYPGIISLLQNLKNQHIGMAIVSNKLDSAVKELNQRFFSDLIDLAIGESPEVRKKPYPDSVFAAMSTLNSNKENSIYVGDSEVDWETAKNAGLKVACVTWGFRDKDQLEKLNPDYLISHPEDLLRIINS